MASAMRFTVRLDPAEEGGYVVQCLEIPGAISQGETREEALENIVDAIEAILAFRRDEWSRAQAEIETVEVDA